MCFDNKNVTCCKELINEWNNPLIKRASRIHDFIFWVNTYQKIKEDIPKNYNIGKQYFKGFVEERICAHTVSFYDPIKQNWLK